jgi:histidinol-phosphate/aromatic aminotransferase/cobyric acid decarboxylase-like protein
LHRNEKIDNWPKELYEEIFGDLPDNFLQCYPNHRPFYERLSKFVGVPENRFVVTSGIDEAAKTLLTLNCAPGDNYAAVWPGYAMYKVYGEMLGAKMAPINYDPYNYLSPEALLESLPKNCKLLFLPNPSQPVENYYPPNELRQIALGCKEKDILLAVDEAYHFFGSESALPLTEEFDNVLVLRTFSKAFGGGSLRLGYVIGSEKGIAPVSAIRLAHEANGLTYHVGSKLLDHYDSYISESIAHVCEGRDFFRDQCTAFGLSAWGQVGNYVLVDFGSKERADLITDELDKNDVLVRGRQPNNLESCIMITCGPIYIMENVFHLIQKILAKE